MTENQELQAFDETLKEFFKGTRPLFDQSGFG